MANKRISEMTDIGAPLVDADELAVDDASDTTETRKTAMSRVWTYVQSKITAAGYYLSGGTDVAVADGGTGASDASTARTNLGVAIGSDVQAHSAVLDATTASFTTADETKLDGIEAAADVTDAANVTAAGALMDSEVDADIKTLALPANTTISAFGATLVDDADAATARTTLGVAIGSDVQAFNANNALTTNRLDEFAAPTADLDINDNALDDVLVPVLTISGTTDTAALADRNGINRCTNASAVTITIPLNATVAFPTGSTLTYRSTGAGGLAVAGAGGVTVNGNKTISQNETILLHKVATDEWDAHGGTAT